MTSLRCIVLASLGLAACQPEIAEVSRTECASGLKWIGGNEGSSQMHPGRNCKECHDFAIAGTVYSEAGLHDANDCLGVAGATVLVEDARGRMLALETNDAGNFYAKRGADPLEFPLSLRVEAGEETRIMAMPAETGACATCHTQDGANAAAGRIIVPDGAAL